MTIADRVRENSTTTGTGSFVLAGAASGEYRTFSQGMPLGSITPYVAVQQATGQWEIGIGTLTNAQTLTRTPTASSNNGNLVDFATGLKIISCDLTAAYMSKVARADDAVVTTAPNPDIASFMIEDGGGNTRRVQMGVLFQGVGVEISDLVGAPAIPDSYLLEVCDPASGTSYKATVAALKAVFGSGTGGTADGTAPTMTGSLTSTSVTQTGFTLNWSAGSDNVGVTRYEYSTDAGATWTSAGTGLSAVITGKTASTTYQCRVRAVDAAGNVSAPLSLSVTTAAPTGDTTAPVMSGSLTATSITQTGYTLGWTAGTDNVAVTGYEYSTDGGTNWTAVGTALSVAVTGKTASTTYDNRVRAFDAAGLRSNVLAANVTTSAPAPTTDYNITPYNNNAILTTKAFSSLVGTNLRYASPGSGYANGYSNNVYWLVNTPTPAKVYCGFGTSATVPPPIITADQNKDGGGALNGMVPMTKANGDAWSMNAYLWVAAINGASNAGPFYCWIQPEDASGNLGVAELLNPAGLTITGV